jgi:NADPH-dependent 7-cyano-7-deazaguanine reductase QueF-like protein
MDKLALKHDDSLLENVVTQLSRDDFEYLMQTYFFKTMDIYKYLELVRTYVALRAGSFDLNLLYRLEQK